MKAQVQKTYYINTLYIIVVFLLIESSCKKETSQLVKLVPATVTDIDGNVYHTLKIGSQVWLRENLKTSHYRNGGVIQNINFSNIWSINTTGAWCSYDNLTLNDSIYGKLYNWYAVNTGNLCPTGWHVPDPLEWGQLLDFLDGNSIAGGKLKETGTSHWAYPNTSASNAVSFTALPGGMIYTNFSGIGQEAYWWCTWSYFWNPDRGYGVNIHYNGSLCEDYIYYNKAYGLSVRCVMD